MSQQQQQQQEDAAAEGPEIVSEFPAPPAFFVLYRDGADKGPPPPEPMEPQYHTFGTPYSTHDAVPDLLPQEGRKLYLNAKSSVSSSSSAGGGSGDEKPNASASSAGDDDSSTSDATGAADGTETKKLVGEVKKDPALEDDDIDYKAQMKK